MANETQNIRARRFVGAMQPGVILVQRRAASPAASPGPNIPNIPNGRGDGRPGPPPDKGNSPSHRPLQRWYN
ncbi:MAG: hypothetical protein M5U34_08285 [Chloroflexi bacterium]|nr:hypothetical protein [Chloroflexota bacterium]